MRFMRAFGFRVRLRVQGAAGADAGAGPAAARGRTPRTGVRADVARGISAARGTDANGRPGSDTHVRLPCAPVRFDRNVRCTTSPTAAAEPAAVQQCAVRVQFSTV